MQCSKCGKTISENESYVSQGKVYCEDCMMDIGLSGKGCDPWATYVDNRARAQAGMKGTDGLTDMEKKVYDFVKQKGRTTRDDVRRGLKLSDTDLSLLLTPLMHTELVKEKSESGNQYLVVIK